MDNKQPLVLSKLQQAVAMGLVCKNCGCRHLYVYRTVNQLHKIIRYRKCRNCGNTVTSLERVLNK